MSPETHQDFAFTVTWNLLFSSSVLFFRGSPLLRQQGGKVSHCSCFVLRISRLLFESSFQSKDGNAEGLLVN